MKGSEGSYEMCGRMNQLLVGLEPERILRVIPRIRVQIPARRQFHDNTALRLDRVANGPGCSLIFGQFGQDRPFEPEDMPSAVGLEEIFLVGGG